MGERLSRSRKVVARCCCLGKLISGSTIDDGGNGVQVFLIRKHTLMVFTRGLCGLRRLERRRFWMNRVIGLIELSHLMSLCLYTI